MTNVEARIFFMVVCKKIIRRQHPAYGETWNFADHLASFQKNQSRCKSYHRCFGQPSREPDYLFGARCGWPPFPL